MHICIYSPPPSPHTHTHMHTPSSLISSPHIILYLAPLLLCSPKLFNSRELCLLCIRTTVFLVLPPTALSNPRVKPPYSQVNTERYIYSVAWLGKPTIIAYSPHTHSQKSHPHNSINFIIVYASRHILIGWRSIIILCIQCTTTL